MRTPKTTSFTRQEFRAETTPVSFAGHPILVLTSAATVSGGEEFAYDVQNLKAATVIGETTKGGANPTMSVPLNASMTASIPYGRAENPVTKTNWEGKGMRPDVAVSATEDFPVALIRLGHAVVANVDAASQSQVFTPRLTPIPSSEAAARRLISGLINNMPDYGSMSQRTANLTRQKLPKLHEDLSNFGELISLKFALVDDQGGDQYDLAFAHGNGRVGVVVSSDGRLQAWGWFGGALTATGVTN